MVFSAVAFDLDGTLYPNFQLFSRLVPFLLKEHRLLRAMDKARRQLRNSGEYGTDFYDIQARLMAEILGESAEKVKDRTERLIYRGWEPFFKKIKLFPHVIETLDAFRNSGVKMGLLSDFPPEIKLKNLNIAGYWDAVVCSECTGCLKPDAQPFLELARKMALPPEEILYVGNSVSYDVEGARRAGMKTALIRRRIRVMPASGGRLRFRRKKQRADMIPDFIFHDYRQLRDYVLG